MSPTVLRRDGFRFFFFSREESRPHVHVSHPDGEAKLWLEPSVEVASSYGLDARALASVAAIVTSHREEIRDAWRRHFGA